MDFSYKVTGANEIARNLDRFGRLLNQNLAMAMEQALIEVEAEVKRECPVGLTLAEIGAQYGEDTRIWVSANRTVSPGNLRRSISHMLSVKGNTISGRVGTNVKYAPYVEFGHRQRPGRFVPDIGKLLVDERVEAKPFMWPAFMNKQKDVQRILAQGVKRAISQAVK